MIETVYAGEAELNKPFKLSPPGRFFCFSSKLNGKWCLDSDFDIKVSINSGVPDTLTFHRAGTFELYYGNYVSYFEALGEFNVGFIEDGSNYLISDLSKIIRDLDYAAYFEVYSPNSNYSSAPVDFSNFVGIIYNGSYRFYDGEVLKVDEFPYGNPNYVYYSLELVCLGKGFPIRFKVITELSNKMNIYGNQYGSGAQCKLSSSDINRGAGVYAKNKLKQGEVFRYSSIH